MKQQLTKDIYRRRNSSATFFSFLFQLFSFLNVSSKASLTLAPIWFPHWPACKCTISRMLRGNFRPGIFQEVILVPLLDEVVMLSVWLARLIPHLTLFVVVSCHAAGTRQIKDVNTMWLQFWSTVYKAGPTSR